MAPHRASEDREGRADGASDRDMAWYGYGRWDFRPYVSVATKRALAARALTKLTKKNGRSRSRSSSRTGEATLRPRSGARPGATTSSGTRTSPTVSRAGAPTCARKDCGHRMPRARPVWHEYLRAASRDLTTRRPFIRAQHTGAAGPGSTQSDAVAHDHSDRTDTTTPPRRKGQRAGRRALEDVRLQIQNACVAWSIRTVS